MPHRSSEQVLEQARRQITERNTAAEHQFVQQRQAQFQREQGWQRLFIGLVLTLLGLILMPGIALEDTMYAVVHGVCAQVHPIRLGGLQLPLCARNTGIYSSIVTTTSYLWISGRSRAGRLPPWPVTAILGVFVAIMAIDGLNSLIMDLGLPMAYVPRNDVRTLTGMGMGTALAVVFLVVFNQVLRRNVEHEQRVFSGWHDLGIVLSINLMILIVIYGNLGLMFWPLAVLSFLGIVGTLYSVVVLIVSLILGYGRSITQLRQLGRPAVFGLFPTLAILALTSLWRYRLGL